MYQPKLRTNSMSCYTNIKHESFPNFRKKNLIIMLLHLAKTEPGAVLKVMNLDL